MEKKTNCDTPAPGRDCTNLTNQNKMPTISSVVINLDAATSSAVVTLSDGTSQTLNSAPSTPVVAPTDVEIDVQLSDGSTKVFVPKV